MNIAVVGCGHVGLVVGACLADRDHSVVCVDTDTRKIELLDTGTLPFYEFELEKLVKENVAWGNLSFTSSFSAGLAEADVAIVTVPVPVEQNNRADMSSMKSALMDIVAALNAREAQKHCTLVIKSTVPPGTCDVLRDMVKARASDRSKVDLVFNPEFLREGSAVDDFRFYERVVIGVSKDDDNEYALELLHDVYKIRRGECSFDYTRLYLVTDFVSAELIKVASNAFLAWKLSYAHILKDLCRKMGISNRIVSSWIGADERIGHSFFQAGIGYGGSCLSKDVRMLGKVFEDASMPVPAIAGIENLNESMWREFAYRVVSYLGGLESKKIALWGLAFKPDTDDTTNSPAVKIARWFAKHGALVTVYDPKSTPPRDLNVIVASDMYSCCDEADVLVIATDWQCFLEADMEEVAKRMRGNDVFLGRAFRDITDADRSTGLKFSE